MKIVQTEINQNGQKEVLVHMTQNESHVIGFAVRRLMNSAEFKNLKKDCEDALKGIKEISDEYEKR